MRRIAGVYLRRDRLVGLSLQDAPSEERLDVVELLGDYGATFGVMRRDFERRVYQETALALPIADRVLDDLGEETVQRGFGSARLFQPA